jgi:hypothetical protein
MMMLMTSSAIRNILFNPIEKVALPGINGSSYYQMVPPSDETFWQEKGYVKH